MSVFRSEGLEHYTDAELVRLLVEGNHEAMAIIFDRYYRLVMSVAVRILRDPAAAEDAVQIVFTDFYQRAKLFDETKGSLRTWLLQYAYGRSYNEKKRLNCHSLGEQAKLKHVDECNGNSRSVFNLGKQDSTRFVEQILPQLSENQRNVIQQVFFEGMKISEVASQTGQPVGNVYHAYYRAMDKLRALVASPEPHTSDRVSLREQGALWLRMVGKAPRQFRRQVQSVKTRTF
jgi:RNA polymerase sigma-70 factor (ECF subfamily)